MWVENPKDDEKENVITYYAKFEVGYADLTIEAKAAKDADPDQCFIYNINGEGISMKVAVPAGFVQNHLPSANRKLYYYRAGQLELEMEIQSGN